MRKMNCQTVRREIEEVATGELLSLSAHDHLKACAECGTFREDRLKLREMLSSLGSVEAPGDFDFRLRARLAKEGQGRSNPFVMRNLSFGFRSATAAALLLLVGAALLFVNFRTSPNSSPSANNTKPSANAVDQSNRAGQPDHATSSTLAANVEQRPRPSGIVQVKKNPTVTDEKVTTNRRGGVRQTQLASLGNTGTNGHLKTRDLSSTGATVLRPKTIEPTGSSAFPIGTSFQSLKVSLDDGRGTSRTISLPSVSFGSQRVLAQGSSPLLASARSDW